MTRRRRLDDEAGGFAGWLYADLLLGLVVVFLGATTVVLVGSSDDGDSAVVTDEPLVTTTTSVVASTTTVPPTKRVKRFYQTPLDLTFYPQDSTAVSDAVADFLEAESLTGEPEVALVLLFGAVGEGDHPEKGAERATEIWPQLIDALPRIFSERALMRPLNDRYLARGQFSAEIFFQYYDEDPKG